VRRGVVSGAPSIRTDSDRPLLSRVSDSSFALPLLEVGARLVLGDLSLPSASVQVRNFLARLPVGFCAAWSPCYRVENPSRILPRVFSASSQVAAMPFWSSFPDNWLARFREGFCDVLLKN